MKGASQNAILRRSLSGGIEILTEKMPLEHLLKIVKTPGGKDLVKNIVKQMGIEGAEEVASYVGNYIADVAFRDPNAEFSLKEMLLSGLGGVISGGVFAGTGTFIGAAANRYSGRNHNTQVAQAARTGTDANAVQSEARADFTQTQAKK